MKKTKQKIWQNLSSSDYSDSLLGIHDCRREGIIWETPFISQMHSDPTAKIKGFLYKLKPSMSAKRTKRKEKSLSSFQVLYLASRSAVPRPTGQRLYLGGSLAANPVWKADTCRKTTSGGATGAKVVNFCPDSLEPVQVTENYLANSSGTAAGMGFISHWFSEITGWLPYKRREVKLAEIWEWH